MHHAAPLVGVPGGVDGSWPSTPLKAVTLLGTAGAIPFAWSDASGLLLTVKPGLEVAAPYAAVFKLDYDEVTLAAPASPIDQSSSNDTDTSKSTGEQGSDQDASSPTDSHWRGWPLPILQ